MGESPSVISVDADATTYTMAEPPISLNVGGTIYTTSLNNLKKYSESMLGFMFIGNISPTCDSEGRYFIDANGEIFKYILNYLRRGQLLLPDDFKEYDLLLAEAEFYKIQPLIDNIRKQKSNDISLNVGGTIYATSLNTLMKYPDSMLGSMFSGKLSSTCDAEGRYFIDANGEVFKYILNYLRRGKLLLPDDFKEYDLLLAEAEFYKIQPLIDNIRKQKQLHSKVKTILLCFDFEVGTNEVGKVFYAYLKVDGIFQMITDGNVNHSMLVQCITVEGYHKFFKEEGYTLTKSLNKADTNRDKFTISLFTEGLATFPVSNISRYEIWSKE